MWHMPQNCPLPRGPEDAIPLLLSLSCSWHVQLALSKDQPCLLVTHSRAQEGSRGRGAGTAHSSPPAGQGSHRLTSWSHCLFSGPGVVGRQCCCDDVLGAPVGSDRAGTCCAHNKPQVHSPCPGLAGCRRPGDHLRDPDGRLMLLICRVS